jgi:hypothetical protein
MTWLGEQKPDLNEALVSWESFLEEFKPLIELLQSHGMTYGEAVNALSTNFLANMMDELLQGNQRPPDGEDWKLD